ncbi:MAG: peptide-methionine (R)-S-oxide reductase MsrB [Saprospirales bacterium]|jgi:peptide-methionine (R)-S-oxide reductase|nr:peptide-methionine (R)-S-oxide reductase MsrB [Saprospirales bacterium]
MLIMKYLAVLLSLFACHFAPSSDVPESAAEASAAPVLSTDTLAPPQYDSKHRLIRITKPEATWKRELNALEYNVLREEGTERAFTGDLWNNHEKGTFICRGCGLPLFSSDAKFESGTGWPSFWKPIKPEYVTEKQDRAYGMVRSEVECARCGGHLGHVFDDGPQPTGLRYCMNSVSMDFVRDR